MYSRRHKDTPEATVLRLAAKGTADEIRLFGRNNVPNNLREEGLVAASEAGNLDTMQLFLNWGAKNYNEALASAAANGRLNAIRFLAHEGATDFYRALIAASASGHLDAINLLYKLESQKFKSKPGDLDLQLALVSAAVTGELNAIQLLVELGAKNLDEAVDGAISSHQHAAIILLLKLGADIELALMSAAARGKLPVILELGYNWSTAQLNEALVAAAAAGKTESIDKLMSMGANLANKALLAAAAAGKSSATALLIDVYKARAINEALELARNNDHKNVVRLIYKNYSDRLKKVYLPRVWHDEMYDESDDR